MLGISQTLLVGTTVLVTFGFVAYIAAVLAAVKSKSVRKPVLVSAAVDDVATARESASEEPGDGVRHQIAWYGAKFVQGAFVLLSASLILRGIATGHAPFASHFEFALAFAWGMIGAHVYFEWKYRLATLGLATLPVILALLVYASTLSYDANPLIPALQNSPLLTMHVFAAALSYGAAVVAFGAAIMYLVAPRVRWRGWPKPEILDEIGYKSAVVTFPLLTIMIILGAIWANIAWGRYWSWDPKETAALVTWLIYGAYLHARVVRGWQGRRSAWLLVLGFAAIVFTYFGNLFFGGMHAYN